MGNPRTNCHFDCSPGIKPRLVEEFGTGSDKANTNKRDDHDENRQRKNGAESELLADVDANIPQKGNRQNKD